MKTNEGIERRPTDDRAALPGEPDATPVEPVTEDVSGEDVEVVVVGACAGEEEVPKDAEDAESADAVSCSGDDTDGADGDPAGDEATASGRLSKVRGLVNLKVDSDRLKSAWRSHTLGRVALLAVLTCVLVIGSAYFFVMQPVGHRLHEVKEQKSLLHDYMVIQQAGAAIGTFKDGLMTGDQRLTVMSEVNLMAEGSGVRIIGDPDLLLKREVSGNIVEYPVRLRVRGTFHEMGEFLSLLERSPRFVLVEEVEIRSEVASKDRESEATVLLSLAAWEG